MKTLFVSLLSFMVLASASFAQQNRNQSQNSGEVVVRVVNESQAAKPATVETAHEWVNFGKNLGAAMREGLSALTDEANKFAGTDAGRFTMAVIAWKVAGDDAVRLLDRFQGIVVGVPVLFVWVSVSIWFWRRNFMKHRVLVSSTGPFWNKTKTYKIVNENIDSNDAAPWFAAIVPVIISLIIVFAVIF